MNCDPDDNQITCMEHGRPFMDCVDRLRAEHASLQKHADEGWKLANERTRQWKEQEAENAALRKEAAEWSYMRANYESLRTENTALKEVAHRFEQTGFRTDIVAKLEAQNAKLREALAMGAKLYRTYGLIASPEYDKSGPSPGEWMNRVDDLLRKS